MPSVVKIDPRRKIVLSTFHGNITGEDVLRHRAIISSDLAFAPDYIDLVDFSSVTLPAVEEDALRSLANQSSLFSSDALHVIVVPQEEAYKMALSYKEMATRSRAKIFVVRSMDEARELLSSMGRAI